MAEKKGCVYFITDGTGCVKIGRSSDRAINRMYQLQCGNPRPLEVNREISCDTKEQIAFESALHNYFSQHRITTPIETEWFTDADYILDIAWKLSAPRIKTLIDVYGIPKTESVKNQWDYEISKFHSYKTKKKDSESKEYNFDAELFDLPTCCAYLSLGRHTVKKIAEEANAIRKYGSIIRYSRSAIVSYLDNGMKNGQLL